MWVGHSQRRRVVVTAIDAISVLGADLATISESLRTGRSGIGIDAERQQLGFRSPLAGILPAVDYAVHFDRKTRKTMGQTALMPAVCSKRAIERSGCAALLDSPRAGILIGNDSSAEPLEEVVNTVRSGQGTTPLGSNKVIMALTSTATINLGPLWKTKGVSLSVSGACASGAHATGLGWMFIAMGMQDTVIAGGSQETCWQSMAAFDALRVFSMNTADPAGAVRPFDRHRDGLVPSGGCATLVLEEYEQAKRRGAPILAEIAGYAFGSDGDHMTTGDGKGAERTMRAALDAAGLKPSDIDYVNAHATATEAGDIAEGTAINAVFGESGPPVSSTKSMTGHECWMAGASELVYSILMMQGGFIAPNRNYTEHDPRIPPFHVAATPRTGVRLRHVLSNSFGFGGTNACVVLRHPEAM
jgi:3-oxoacyl-[acyl-carrier-protein] synthase-1